MKKLAPALQVDVMITIIRPFIKDCQIIFGHILSVCRRLKAKIFRPVINEYRRLVKDRKINNQGFKEFDKVAPFEGGASIKKLCKTSW